MVQNETITEENTPKSDDDVWTQGPDGELIPDYDSTFPIINEGEVVSGKVVRVDKDEVLIDIGYKSEGVIPVSELSIRRSVNPADEVNIGDEIDALVMTKEDADGRLILSKKRARFEMAWKRIEMRQAILDRLSPGDVVTGTISNIVDFGAFVDLEGIDGLIHISELSWSHVNHPSELLEIGQEVQVKVLDIDRERQRISLGLKQTQSDPWQQVVDMYDQGDVIEGKVTKVVTFGAFIAVVPGVEGLVHSSELAQHHVENPREVVTQGESVRAKIIEMDPERRRLSLSLKRVDEGEGGTGVGEGATELGLSEEVFAENMAEEPASGEALAASAAQEPVPEESFVEEPPAEQSDESIEADSVAPEDPGPGDSEGGYPAPPEEKEPT